MLNQELILVFWMCSCDSGFAVGFSDLWLSLRIIDVLQATIDNSTKY